MQSSERIVFSTLFSEGDEFLPLLVANFLHFAPQDSHLMISHGGRLVNEAIASDRVTVFKGGTKREKWGHTLLDAHLECLQRYEALYGSSDYFCTLASNSLFFRPVDLAAVKSEMKRDKLIQFVNIDDLPDVWQWGSVKLVPQIADGLKSLGVENLCWNQIEGLISSWGNWRSVANGRGILKIAGESIPEGVNISFEELVPASTFIACGDGCFANICKNFWDRYNSTGDGGVRFNDFFTEHESHISLLKWFDRSDSSVETFAVTAGLGVPIMEAIQAGPLSKSLPFAGLMIKASSKIIDSLEFSVALNRDIGSLDSDGAELTMNGAYADFPLSKPDQHLSRSIAYLYAEDTGIPCHVRVWRDSERRIHWRCTGENLQEGRAQAYLYLYMGKASEISGVVRSRGLAESSTVIFAVNERHIPVIKPTLVDGEFIYHSAPPNGVGSEAVYFGWPITPGAGSVFVEFSSAD